MVTNPYKSMSLQVPMLFFVRHVHRLAGSTPAASPTGTARDAHRQRGWIQRRGVLGGKEDERSIYRFASTTGMHPTGLEE